MINIWHIQEGFYLQKRVSSVESFSLNRGDDSIIFHADEIDDLIDALKRAKSQIQQEEAFEAEVVALKRWGNEKTPMEDR